jgi:hypothetical protein
MALTRDFQVTVKEMLDSDPAFRRELLLEAISAMFEGEDDLGKCLLRSYINGTIGFQRLAECLNRSRKSLMRMLAPDGNPRVKNLFEIVAILQQNECVRLELRAVKAAA